LRLIPPGSMGSVVKGSSKGTSGGVCDNAGAHHDTTAGKSANISRCPQRTGTTFRLDGGGQSEVGRAGHNLTAGRPPPTGGRIDGPNYMALCPQVNAAQVWTDAAPFRIIPPRAR